MADSLVVGHQIELLGGGVASTDPQCLGATFLLVPGYDLSAPQFVSDMLMALSTDGERPLSRRAGNRTPSLPIKITAPDRATLAAAREVLLQAVSDDFTLTWTRDGGLPLVLDCFAMGPPAPAYDLDLEQELVSQVVVSFSALPYGRSDTPVSVALASPITGGSVPPASVVLDTYSTVSGPNWTQSAKCVVGPNSAHWDPCAAPISDCSGTGSTGGAAYSRTFAAVSVAGRTALSVWLGLGSGWWNTWHRGKVRVHFTLTDNAARVLRFSVTRKLTASNSKNDPKWARVTAPFPQSLGSFDTGNVTGYSVTVSNWQTPGGTREMRYANVYLDQVTAVAQSVGYAATRGWVYDVLGVLGTARAPVSVAATQAAGAGVQYTITLPGPAGTPQSWIPPGGVTSVNVVVTGPGGNGGNATANGGCAGGGAGAEEGQDVAAAVTPGVPCTYVIGAAAVQGGPAVTATTFTADSGVPLSAAPGGDGGSTASGGGTAGAVAAATVAGNFLTGDNSTFETSIGTWTGAGNCGTTWSAAQAHGGGHSLAMTSVAAGDASAAHCQPANITTQGMRIAAGGQVTVTAWFRAAVSARTCRIGASFTDASGVSTGTLYGTGAADTTTGWTQVTATLTAPAGSALCRANAQVQATGGASEVHYCDDVTLSPVQVHHSGGAGSAGVASTSTGAGGSSGGTAANGNAAAGTTGGAAVTGGGAGAAGSTFAGNGHPGGQPGGGGAGARSAGATAAGGTGGNGQIVLTYTTTQPNYSALLLHAPGPDSPGSLSPLVALNPADLPDGTIEYPVVSLTAGQNADFDGTYTPVLVNAAWNTSATARTVTVTVKQYEYPGGPSYTKAVTRTFTPDTDVRNGVVILPEVTLPVADVAPDNTAAYYTVTVTDSNTADDYLDLVFLDTAGRTVLINHPAASAYGTFYADEPETTRALGRVMGSDFDRAQAVSVLQYTDLYSGPVMLMPGDNRLLAYSPAGAPALGLTYSPRFYLDRI